MFNALSYYSIPEIQIKFFILTEINSFTPTTITSKQNIFYIYFFTNYMRYGSFDFSCAEVYFYIFSVITNQYLLRGVIL
ncbi:hypothetical protein T4D_11707 [Trichinella pseudospiralis]|uniref:Uncharacterized protein n=1 Tax=Trichinella pseudospiralis TaxID=6337 RepID=A0A0V1FVZ7_TRIPS|nr:hypothetical protein T4D_11707 [Trichinella pseudospiralis]